MIPRMEYGFGPDTYSNRLLSIQAFFSCTCSRWVSRSR